MPVIDKGIVEYQSYRSWWYIQPHAETPVSKADFVSFIDPSRHNLAYYKGEVRLLDPFAVVKLT